jgi:hypothetical protein
VKTGNLDEVWDRPDSNLPERREKPPKRRLIMEDTTIEGVCTMLASNPRGMLLHADEAMGWIASFDAYRSSGVKGKDQAFWLLADGGGPYSKDRANSDFSILVPNLSVSIVAGIQHSRLREIAPTLVSDGFIQRAFCIESALAPRGADRAEDVEAKAAYTKLITRLLQLPATAPTLQLGWEAHGERADIEEIADAYKALPSSSEALKQHLGKWDGRFARLLLTFHAIECASRGEPLGSEIPGDTAKRVRDFMVHYLLPQSRRFYSQFFRRASVDEADPTWIAGYILAHKLTTVTLREIKRAYHVDDERRIEAAMVRLNNWRWVGAKQADPSKRSVSWEVNPAVHTRFAKRAAKEKQWREAERKRVAEARRRIDEIPTGNGARR